jgi:hypothetical protein
MRATLAEDMVELLDDLPTEVLFDLGFAVGPAACGVGTRPREGCAGSNRKRLLASDHFRLARRRRYQ